MLNIDQKKLDRFYTQALVKFSRGAKTKKDLELFVAKRKITTRCISDKHGTYFSIYDGKGRLLAQKNIVCFDKDFKGDIKL